MDFTYSCLVFFVFVYYLLFRELVKHFKNDLTSEAFKLGQSLNFGTIALVAKALKLVFFRLPKRRRMHRIIPSPFGWSECWSSC